ncbi:MAG: hypothetical protein ING06_16780 [Roseomonas sp.]|nr:hypothetical protein [Roseomonas sp.]
MTPVRRLAFSRTFSPLKSQIGSRNWAGGVVERPPADAERLGLFRLREGKLTVDHRFALSNPALVSAPAKKSFVSVNSPIFAWSSFT